MKKEKTTIHDIAKKLNITASTVSRALNDHPRISSETKKAVLKAAQKLNYQTNHIAAALRNGKSNLSGVTANFLTEDFLLSNDFAQTLYHQYAKDLPIIDYHCHLSPQEIAGNRQFENLTRIWLDGDHYKWRAMRTLGIAEKFITGNAPDHKKFDQWAYAVPYTIRNPLYHWSHLELKRYFEVEELITPGSATSIYNACSEQLRDPSCSTRNLLRKMNVEVVCTTDDPAENLSHHEAIRQNPFGSTVLPTFRPDKAYAVEYPEAYKNYLAKLSESSDIDINSFSSLLRALEKRILFFHQHGCRLADHGLENLHFPETREEHSAEALFQKVMKQETLDKSSINYFKYQVLITLGRLYHKMGWTQQYHLGALRNTNSRMLRTLGPDSGFDSIGDFPQSTGLARFLNELDSSDQLAQTILYNINPVDNEVIATMTGNFNDGSAKGKIQFGSAWWFMDQKDGMENQLNTLSNLGLLSCFIGMITDSRSFLSYPRHEYFRRILCNLIGKDVANGELPADEKWLGKIVSDICYHNAKAYFKF